MAKYQHFINNLRLIKLSFFDITKWGVIQGGNCSTNRKFSITDWAQHDD